MTARSIRRAAERKQRKLAHKAEKVIATSATSSFETAPRQVEHDPRRGEAGCPPGSASFSPEPPESFSISPAQLAANRANSQLSTGPKTSEGKASSCLNAVKTALTGRTVMLPSEDASEYERHIRAYEKELRPIGQRECDLVQSIADTTWRLSRIPVSKWPSSPRAESGLLTPSRSTIPPSALA